MYAASLKNPFQPERNASLTAGEMKVKSQKFVPVVNLARVKKAKVFLACYFVGHVHHQCATDAFLALCY
jgi:hypothetical protein